MIFMMVLSCLEVEVLFSWLWAKRCDFAGIKKLGWYSVGRVRVSLVLNRFSLINYHTGNGLALNTTTFPTIEPKRRKIIIQRQERPW